MALEQTSSLPDGVYQSVEYKPEPNWLEVNTAAFRRESPVANFVRQQSTTMPEPSEEELDAYVKGEFDPVAMLTGTKFENSPLQKYYTGLKSPSQVEYQMGLHDAEIATTETMGDGFFKPLVGTVLGALASPTTAMGAGLAYKLPATMAGRAFAAAGINMGLSAVDEFLLQQTQDTRTAAESAMVVGLGGVLGGIIGAVGRSPVQEIVRQTATYTDSASKSGGAAKVLTDISQTQLDEINADVNLSPAEKTVKIHDVQGENYQLANQKALKVASFGGFLYKMMPDMYMFSNKSNVMRRVANKWLSNPLLTEGNKKFKGDTPLDVRAARMDELIDYGIDSANSNGFAAHKKAGGTMDKAQFDREFQNAIADNGQHAIPEVAKAAQEFDLISKRIGREAVKEKILLGDAEGNPLVPLGDKNWFLRTWSSNYALRTDELPYATTLTDLHVEQLKIHADAEAQKMDNRAVSIEENEYGSYTVRDENGKDIGYFNLADNGKEMSILPDINKGYGQLTYREVARMFPDKKLKSTSDLSPDAEAMWNRLVDKGMAEKQQIGTFANGESHYIYNLTHISPLARDVSGMKAKLKADSKGKSKLEIEKLKTAYKKELAEVRKEAKKAKETPAQKKYEAALTAEGRTKIIDNYRGMHRQVRSGDGMESGGSSMRVGFDGQIAPSPGRTVDIPTARIPSEFLEGDAVMGATRALKRLSRQVLIKQDERFGDDMLGNIKADLYEEYNAKRAVLEAKGKSTKKLAAEHEKNTTYLNNMLREYYNIKPPAANNALKELAQYLKLGSVMTKLGGVMMSTLPEVAAGLNSVGVRGYMHHVAGWVSNSKDMRAMTRAQREDYSLGLQGSMSLRIAEMGEYDAGMSATLRKAHQVTDITLDKAFGLGIWTRMITAQSGIMIQSKIGRLMFKDVLSKTDKVDLARMGLDETAIKAIKKQVRLHGKKISGGSVDMRIGEWKDEHIAQKVMDAVFGETENTIIKPRTGSTPFIGKTAIGSLLLQFKQFTIASTSRYRLADMQRIFSGDIRALERQIAFIGMGALSWELKKMAYGQSDKEETDAEYLASAMSHGGGIGMALELMNFADEQVNGGNSRYLGNRSLKGMVTGPGVGLLSDGIDSAGTLARMFTNGDVSEGDVRKLRRVIPGNNWLVTKPLFNMGQDALYKEFEK